ncbi:MAG TPA: universal stress protein [Streptosporangiaceae bacterium]|nr:universal stress protein [Streptosporangiaceae bacterium]
MTRGQPWQFGDNWRPVATHRPESVTVRAVHGVPAEEILNAGADAGMIVVGSRGGGGFARLLLGSVSATVAEHAKVPVMILPA